MKYTSSTSIVYDYSYWFRNSNLLPRSVSRTYVCNYNACTMNNRGQSSVGLAAERRKNESSVTVERQNVLIFTIQ